MRRQGDSGTEEATLGMSKESIEVFCREVVAKMEANEVEECAKVVVRFANELSAKQDAIHFRGVDVSWIDEYLGKYGVQDAVWTMLGGSIGTEMGRKLLDCIQNLGNVERVLVRKFARKELVELILGQREMTERYFSLFGLVVSFPGCVEEDSLVDVVTATRDVVSASEYAKLLRLVMLHVVPSVDKVMAMLQSLPRLSDVRYLRELGKLYATILKQGFVGQSFVAESGVIDVLRELLCCGKADKVAFKLLLLCITADRGAKELAAQPEILQRILAFIDSTSESDTVLGIRLLGLLLPEAENVLLDEDLFDIWWANVYPSCTYMPAGQENRDSGVELRKASVLFIAQFFACSSRFREMLLDYDYVAIGAVVLDIEDAHLTQVYMKMLVDILGLLERSSDSDARESFERYWADANPDEFMEALETCCGEDAATFRQRVDALTGHEC